MALKQVAFVDGKEIRIKENIVDETKIVRWLTQHHPPPTMTRFVDFSKMIRTSSLSWKMEEWTHDHISNLL